MYAHKTKIISHTPALSDHPYQNQKTTKKFGEKFEEDKLPKLIVRIKLRSKHTEKRVLLE